MNFSPSRSALKNMSPKKGTGDVMNSIIVNLLSKTRSICYNKTINAHPIKLRERTLRLLDNGHKKTEITELLDISCDSLERRGNLGQETGNLKNNASKRTAYKIDREKLAKHYEENHHATNKETAVIFGCSPSGIGKAKKSLKITRKKHKSIHRTG